MRLRSRIWMAACTLSWLANAGELPRNQLIEGFLSYIQKVDNVVLDAAKLAEARQGLQKSPPGEPLLQPYVFVGDRLGREALMVSIEAGILKWAQSDIPLNGGARYASERKNLEGLSDAELVMALRLVEQIAGKVETPKFDGRLSLVMVPGKAVYLVDAPAETLEDAKMRPARRQDAGNLRQIGMALQTFSHDNGGTMPDDLGALMRTGLLTAGTAYVSPASGTPPPTTAQDVAAGRCDYIYVGKGGPPGARAGGVSVLAVTKPGILGGDYVNVLYGMDGFVLGYSDPPAEVRAILEKYR